MQECSPPWLVTFSVSCPTPIKAKWAGLPTISQDSLEPALPPMSLHTTLLQPGNPLISSLPRKTRFIPQGFMTSPSSPFWKPFSLKLMDQEISITWGFTRKVESQALIPDLVSQNLPQQDPWCSIYPFKCKRTVVGDVSCQPHPPLSSVHRSFQARILEWVAISSSQESSWHRDWTHDSCVSCISTAPSGKSVYFIYLCITDIKIQGTWRRKPMYDSLTNE